MSDQEHKSKKPKIEAADIAEAADIDEAADIKMHLQYMMIVLACWALDDLFPMPWLKKIAHLSFRCTLIFSRLQTKVEPCDWEQMRSEIDSTIVDFNTVKNCVMDVTQSCYWARILVRTPSDLVDDGPADNADIEDSQLPGLEETQTAADI